MNRSPRKKTHPLGRSVHVALVFTLAWIGCLAVAPSAAAQGLANSVAPPSADWRTLESENFRVHYPVESAAWAERVASSLEEVRARVVEEVGYAPRERVDVVVSDPVAAANGFALPFLGWPRMVLWTTPPGADSVIGYYRDWSELLLVHEDTHLVHLLRPSRNPLRQAVASLVPLSPLSSTPRWISEGYATVVEGRLTGSGRPQSDLRAAILRRWALAGKLPSYGRLASDDGSYLGMSMAYLAGSAYLEWLEAEAGEGSLRDLWARVTARRARTFEQAFQGVFDDSPRNLWDRFRAETTYRALELERRLEVEAAERAADGADATGSKAAAEAVQAAETAQPGGLSGSPWHQGDLWLDLDWATGAPAVSPDGSRFAVVLRSRDAPTELAVFTTEVDTEALADREGERRRIAEADPQDVAARTPGPPPRRRLHTLGTLDGAPPSQPRWLAASEGRPEALLLVRSLPDAEGFLVPDLFRWSPEEGRLERLTRGAALRDPDPAPAAADGAGTWAVAVRHRHGFSQVVRVDLLTGELSPLTEPSVERIYDAPRLSPDGRRLAYLRHEAGSWSLVVRTLNGGEGEEPVASVERVEEILPVAPGTWIASPAWESASARHSAAPAVTESSEVTREEVARETEFDGEDSLVAAVGQDGFIDLVRFTRDPAALGGWRTERLTRVPGAALAPEPAPAVGEEPAGIFYLSLEPDGLDVRRLASRANGIHALHEVASESLAGIREELWPVVPPPPGPAPPPSVFDAEPVGAEPVGADAVGQAEAEGEPYGLGPRREWLPLFGGAVGAAGTSGEVGARVGDLLGRAELVALAAWGEEGAAEGASLAAAWRAQPVEWSLHLVTLEEQPSRQAGLTAGGDTASVRSSRVLNLERSGAELAAAWQRRRGGGPLRLGAGAWWGIWERSRLAASGGAADTLPLDVPLDVPLDDDEISLFAEVAWSPRTARGESWAGLDLSGRWDAGDSGAAGDWRRWIGGARLAAGWGGWELSGAWRRGEASGEAVEGAVEGAVQGAVEGDAASANLATVAAPWQLFRVGGLPSSLRPSSFVASRIEVPALPEATLVGRELEVQRLDLTPGLAPLPLFWARYRVASDGPSLGDVDWLTVAGVEWRGRFGPVPLLRLPGLEYRLGGAERLDGPAEGDREWWVSLSYRH